MTAPLAYLKERVRRREARLGVIGLGYVGLPVACAFAGAGFPTTGVDVRSDRVRLINEGFSPIGAGEPGVAELLAEVTRTGRLVATMDYREIGTADLVLIDVETPVGADHRPRFEALRAACSELGGVLKPGALVVVESTIAPGTMESLVVPVLEASSGGHSGSDFFAGHCPERVMPGKLLSNLRTVGRVLGGQTPAVAEVMREFYGAVVDAELDATDMLTAEFVKTTENAFRDVNIAFANEVAMLCERLGADVFEVRDLVNKVPGRLMHVPGAGVGGHCIPKDPWLLASAGEGDASPLIETARGINDGMPAVAARLVEGVLHDLGVPPSGARVVVLGYAYLEDSDDSRLSPTLSLLPLLSGIGCEVTVHDPLVPGFQGDLMTMLKGADCAVVMVAHSDYRRLDLAAAAAVMRRPGLVVGRPMFSQPDLERAGFVYRSLGIGRRQALVERA